jgi:hypothetical protein
VIGRDWSWPCGANALNGVFDHSGNAERGSVRDRRGLAVKADNATLVRAETQPQVFHRRNPVPAGSARQTRDGSPIATDDPLPT